MGAAPSGSHGARIGALHNVADRVAKPAHFRLYCAARGAGAPKRQEISMSTSSASSPSLPADEYLSDSELSELHGILQQQLGDLLDAGRQAVHDASQVRESEADELDIAITESNRDFALRMADRERRLLKKIRHALEEISQGSYGTCESCGASITYKRLLARPVARLCIDCKTEAEQLEGRTRYF